MTALDHRPEPAHTLALALDPDGPDEIEFTCPCPLRGLRCGDCMMIAFAPPPFKATPLGWTLATGRRFGWWLQRLFTKDN